MKSNLRVASCVLGLAQLSACAGAKANVAVRAPPPPSGFAKGINMGNYLDGPDEGAWTMNRRLIEDEDFRRIHEAGFDSVRIPVRFSNHAARAAPYTIHPAFLSRVTHVVQTALASGLTVVLDMHHYNDVNAGGDLMKNPIQEHDRFVALWDQIATHFKDFPSSLYFEVLNEPTDDLIAGFWDEYQKDAYRAIRRTNPTRIVVVGPSGWSSLRSLPSMVLPDDSDPNIVVTFHYYEPMAFTHQGADWLTPVPPCTASWGAEVDKMAIDGAFERAKEWATEHGRRLYLGEFGVYGQCAKTADRVAWTAYVRSAAEASGFAWAYWEYSEGFGAWDPVARRWRPELLEALLPEPPGTTQKTALRQ